MTHGLYKPHRRLGDSQSPSAEDVARCARRMKWADRISWAVFFAFVIIGILLSQGVLPADAHEAWINWGGYKGPDGVHCCGANDCFVVPASQVKATPSGYLLEGGEVVPYSEAQQSEDGDFWRCKKSDGSRRCFFSPQPGS